MKQGSKSLMSTSLVVWMNQKKLIICEKTLQILMSLPFKLIILESHITLATDETHRKCSSFITKHLSETGHEVDTDKSF